MGSYGSGDFPAGYWTSETAYNTEYSYDANGNITELYREGDPTNPDMDDLTYHYYAGTNKLEYIEDAVTGDPYPDDIHNQSPGNYDYDANGNLIYDFQGDIEEITWTVYGKIHSIGKGSGQMLYFYYDAAGNRVKKVVVPPSGPTVSTYYVRDATGNVLSTYTVTNTAHEQEVGLFGSSRLGLYKKLLNNWDESADEVEFPLPLYSRYLNRRAYELTDHLGNVRGTVNDRLNSTISNAEEPTDICADVLRIDNYYPFGMLQVSRHYESESFRYGYQNQEKENEIAGEGNHINFKFRGYDTRTGRFWSVDPLANKYPFNSPYAFSENRVIDAIELEGLEKVPANEVWDLKQAHTTVSLTTADINFETFQVAKIHGRTVTLYPIISGPNKGNYVAGRYTSTENGKTFSIGYVVGASRVSNRFNVGDIGAVATGGYLAELFSDSDKPLTLSLALNNVQSVNINNYGYYDETTGNFVATYTMLDGMKEILTDPLTYLPSPAKIKLKPGHKNWNGFLKDTKGQYNKGNYPGLSTKQINTIRSSDYLDWQFQKVDVQVPAPNINPNESEEK